MNIQVTLTEKVKAAFHAIYETELPTVEFQATRKEFEGDITVVIFPMLRVVKGNPVQIGESIGNYLVEHVEEVKAFNVVKGFLNVVIDDSYYFNFFNSIKDQELFGYEAATSDEDAMMVEYSSPNTNKPLHLGHIRNNLLGYSVAEILKAAGKKVYKTQIINDRGIHICKSMLAWQKFGNGETPESAGVKGDKLVGNYYVAFEKAFQEEFSNWLESEAGVAALSDFAQNEANQKAIEAKSKDKDLKAVTVDLYKKAHKNDYFAKDSVIGAEAKEMLRKWEAGDEDVVALWKTMNQWVYDGFDITYKALGVDFDSYYYESDTYLLGKDNIEEGLAKGVFYKKEDGSVWCDLSDENLDDKLVLRADGTAVYMTQDIGTAIQRVKDRPNINGMIYTVGNEQDHHFKVLFLILKKLGYEWAENLYHLSYGMVDLPSGKMKSREGTVVDADDLMHEMANTAKEIALELGKLDGFSDEEKEDIYKIIGLGALKYYILKVDPKKRIMFDPKESVDFNGNSGPFNMMAYVRTRSILRKADFDYSKEVKVAMHEKEKEVIKQIALYPEIIQLAAKNLSPALIANYTYDLVKLYNSMYQAVLIFSENEDEKIFRVQLSALTGNVIKSAFALLGINVPERM